MIKTLISHQWKDKTRSTFWKKNVIANIFIGFLIAYLVLNVVAIAYFIDVILLKIYPDTNIIEKFTNLLFYYFTFDLVSRFLIQQLPVIKIIPYLNLPINKNKIFNFLMLKSVFSLFNILPLIILFPFAFKVIFIEESLIFGISWLTSITLLIFSNNFIVFFLKKKFIAKPIFVLAIYALIIGIFYLDSTNYISVSNYFEEFILWISKNPIFVFIPILMLSASYFLSLNLMKKYAYLDAIQTKTRKNGQSTEIAILNNFGKIGNLIQLELKMIWRGKRSKAFVFIALFFMIYGFLFYGSGSYKGNLFLMGFGVLFTFTFTMQYVQLLFAWESPFFDLLNTKNINTSKYLISKYYLLTSTNIISFILTAPFAFFNIKILLFNLIALIFNNGVNIFIQIYFATLNKTRINNSKGVFFNHEGIHVIQYIIILPLIGLPAAIFYPFYSTNYENMGLFAVGSLGLLGFLLRNQIIKLLAKQLKKKKYAMLVGFRK